MPMPYEKYRPYETVDLPDRTWPDVVVTRAPIWCSTDLRDGNQALVNPMDTGRKRRFFDLLVAIGVNEIEVGFPSASKTDFDFVRTLVEDGLIPRDVTIAVLTQARPELIERTFEAIEGAERAIVHLYNSTSVTQRRVVFRMDRDGITELAVKGTRLCKRLAAETATEIVFQYSPESFHHTELDYALEICEAVADEWGPTPAEKMIVNLPTTVEQFPPNVYADRIEWFGREFTHRDSSILSVHPHNDRGTAVATAELGLMAGAERVEGTLFGNGERTGNVDMITIALNLLTQGVDPGSTCRRSTRRVRIVEECNELPVHPRHPYAGELVYTAFSGSHQDAIKKGMDAQERSGSPLWDVPYLSIDPKDVGRSYEAIIRVNSQSGKGGVAYLMAADHHLELPRGLQVDFARKVQQITDGRGGELTSAELMETFSTRLPRARRPLRARRVHALERGGVGPDRRARTGRRRGARDRGRGKRAARRARRRVRPRVRDHDLRSHYHEHAMSASADAKAAAYVEADVGDEAIWGVGVHSSILTASLRAIVNAVNRSVGDPTRGRRSSPFDQSEARVAAYRWSQGRPRGPPSSARPPSGGEMIGLRRVLVLGVAGLVALGVASYGVAGSFGGGPDKSSEYEALRGDAGRLTRRRPRSRRPAAATFRADLVERQHDALRVPLWRARRRELAVRPRALRHSRASPAASRSSSAAAARSRPRARTSPGTVEGDVTAADVVGPNGQGIEPGSFGEILKAMRAGVAYANIHTTRVAGRRDPRPDRRQEGPRAPRRLTDLEGCRPGDQASPGLLHFSVARREPSTARIGARSGSEPEARAGAARVPRPAGRCSGIGRYTRASRGCSSVG